MGGKFKKQSSSVKIRRVGKYETILPFHNTSAPVWLRLPVPHVSTKTTKIITEFTRTDSFYIWNEWIKGCRMGRSDKVSLWYVALLINTRFRFLFFNKQMLSAFNVTLRQRTSKWLREAIKL